MKSLSLIIAIAGLFAMNRSLAAQDNVVAGKVFYAELGGPGVIMSANFDTRFTPNERLGFGCRIGAGFGLTTTESGYDPNQGYYYDNITRTYYSIPVGLNYIFGKPSSSSTFEVGGGITLLTRSVALYYYDYKKGCSINMMLITHLCYFIPKLFPFTICFIETS